MIKSLKVYKKNADNLFCADYIISETETDLTPVGGLTELFNISKQFMKTSKLYCENRVFSEFCQTRIMKVKGQNLLWRKIAYIEFGYNGNQYVSHEIILSPSDAEPKYKHYQQTYYGLTMESVRDIEVRY